MRRTRKMIMVVALAGAAFGIFQPTSASATTDPSPPFISPDASWLTVVNYYRAMSDLPPVVDNPALDPGAYAHSCYMLFNGISHDEIPGKVGYTTAGDRAGNNSNVATSSVYGTSARKFIDLWMTGPFHAIGVLRPGLTNVGFGKCDHPTAPAWHSAATLDVLSGLGAAPVQTDPILFPGDGTTTSLSTFVTESPNPLTFCGWTGAAGLPVIAMMPEGVASASARMTGPNGVVPTCALYAGNTNSTASQILGAANAVTVVPRTVLEQGRYTVTVTTQARTITWSFNVDPTAATGVMPIPTVEPAGPLSAYTAVSPYRFADSRTDYNIRISHLMGKTVKMVKVAGTSTGTGALPTNITAISANITVVFPQGNGFVTIYNCASPKPLASAINFSTAEVVGNAGVFPLSSDGSLCLYSNVTTDIVIDINGYFRSDSASSYRGMTPTPLVDSTKGLGTDGRLTDGETITLDVPSAQVGVPSGATAVAVIITGINPAGPGFVTAYPCGGDMPVVSSVNPAPGSSRSNFAIVPLSANGKLCLYTLRAIDLKVDVLGYFVGGGTSGIIPATPTRVVDTRDAFRPEMNFDNDGAPMKAGTVYQLNLAGQRGIPSTAKSVALNVAIVLPGAAGTLKVTPCGTSTAANAMSYAQGAVVNSGMQVTLSANGSICLVSSASTHLVIDVVGWWT